jgi:O-antigen ligase
LHAGIIKDILDPHNDYVRSFVEQGIVGLATFMASHLYLFMHALKNIRSFPEGSVRRKVNVFLICYVPSYLLMSVSENLIRYTTVHWYVWTII